MFKIVRMTIAVAVWGSATPMAVAATLYAKVSGQGSCICGQECSCDSWANACTLSQAITCAASGDEVWVQAGTYGSISLKNGVKIIGGFTGTEAAASQSNPVANQTILSGGGSTQAVWSTDNAASTMLRGFTIANGHDSSNDGGGGLQVTDSSAMFVQCVFKNNTAGMFGAAAAVRGSSSPQFINCEFHDNGTGSGTGVQPLGAGAVYLHSGSPTFANCLFYNNKAGEGGVLVNVSGTPTFINCTFADNEATIGSGGALHDHSGAAVVRNSILWGNTATHTGAQVYNSVKSVTTVTYSDVQGGFWGIGNIDSDPVVQVGANNYKLQQSSPCKNAGQNTGLPADVADLDWDGNTTEQLPKDLYLNSRRIESVVDMGVYETPRDLGGQH